jgi:hypothetical protein
MFVSVTRDRIQIGAGSDKEPQKKCVSTRRSTCQKILENSCDLLNVPTSHRHSRVPLGTCIGIFQVI